MREISKLRKRSTTALPAAQPQLPEVVKVTTRVCLVQATRRVVAVEAAVASPVPTQVTGNTGPGRPLTAKRSQRRRSIGWGRLARPWFQFQTRSSSPCSIVASFPWVSAVFRCNNNRLSKRSRWFDEIGNFCLSVSSGLEATVFKRFWWKLAHVFLDFFNRGGKGGSK